jgi:chemotaxis protein CheD
MPNKSPHFARTRINDPRLGEHTVRVQPGEFFVSGEAAAVVVTVLGSCVSACIRDFRTGFGGMNHFMLPESDNGEWGGASSRLRYGNYAMEALINAVLASGCPREQLEIKLFGGANMFVSGTPVGTHGRRIHYSPATGKVQRLLLTKTQDSSLALRETAYRSRLSTTPVEGDIELFQ